MKTILQVFNNSEFKRLKKAKGKMTWHDFIMQLVEEKQREILDSIHYAKRIQMALMPNENYISKKMKKL